jgi:ferredoxin
VETWANVAPIITKGADWFASIGTEKSKGTKVFALSGKVNNVGLVEVPMGITLRDIIYEIGGGIPGGRKFKAVQTGGPLGGCLPEEMLDTPVDYVSLTRAGATMGSGGMIVVDDQTCMVEFSKFFLEFAQAESCGQCTPCRAGGKQMLEILTRITEGHGKPEDLDNIRRVAKTMAEGSLCALGRLTPSPVLSTLRYFEDEYREHIFEHKCRALRCKPLFSYQVDQERCRLCSLCQRNCAFGAVIGDRKSGYHIDSARCNKCGQCHAACRFDAVVGSWTETDPAVALNAAGSNEPEEGPEKKGAKEIEKSA